MSIKRIWISVISVIILACLFSGCGLPFNINGGAKDNDDNTEKATSSPSDEPSEKVIYRIENKNIKFAGEAEREAWREKLIYLYENEAWFSGSLSPDEWQKSAKSSDESGKNEDYIIHKGYNIALFDVDVDGTPELLADMGGGSAGNACYEVYDLNTGDLIGNISGGFENSWCVYLNITSGEYEAIGQFQWRNGWSGRDRYINNITVLPEPNKFGEYIYDYTLFHTYHEMHMPDGWWEEDAEYVPESDYKVTSSFYTNAGRVSMVEYFEAEDMFFETRERISETAIQVLGRGECGDTPEEIADALLSTCQEFILP